MSESRRKRVPTMNDVARLAKVSQTTVSFVINNTASVSIPDETRQRVWAAIEQLGYRPNAQAQGLRMQRSGIVGFVTDTIAITPYAGKIFEGAQDVAWENNKILLLVNTKGQPDIEETALEKLLERQVEGVIYAMMYHRPVKVPAALQNVPTVLVDCFAEDRSLPSVVPDEVNGGRIATETLLKKGHRRVAFINNVDPIPATFGRLQGYRAALANHGVPVDESLVCNEESSSGGGHQGAMKLMQLPEPPTAIFCFNDQMAIGVYDALRKHNRRIPEDVAVIGFDNLELVAVNLYPSLTTMELPHYKMGVWAVQKLVKIISGLKTDQPEQYKIECPLIERESV
jgi:LacI family transcriptional regulator